MNLKVNSRYHGFILKENRFIDEIKADAYIFQHEKTKAKLIKLSCEDDNKVFAIGFRTPPDNSTGVPHILEHSVLCGSRKYDVKEPFVELVKSSLNTFLNAMTYPDKTIYPIASRNEKDFYNLMDVYLDAVFYPNIYKYKEIFMQEGWSYKLENKDDELTYNGVVYSEMKGAYSSPESCLYRQISNVALPDTQYKNSSGGDPDYIPDLTYEEFLDFHRKYYHPSNSYIFLYGNGDLDKELSYINDNYLKNFEYKEVNSKIINQEDYKEVKEQHFEYGIADNEDDKNKTYLNINFLIDKSTNTELYYAFEILSHMLLTSAGAPLKKVLIDKGIAKSVTGEYDNGMNQTLFSIIAKNSEESKKDEFKDTIFSELKKLVEEGIDKDVIMASVNKVEFALREAESYGYPKGLIYYSKILDSYLYDGDPLCHLQYENTFKKIRKEMFNGYFENLIEKYLLNNKNVSIIVMKPKKGLNEEKEIKLKEKLDNKKKNFTEEEIYKIIDEGKNLLARQNTPDKKENLDKLPSLTLKDINKKAENVPTDMVDFNGIKYLYHDFNTNKIAYISLNFKSDCISSDDISYLRLLSDILGKMNTKNYDYVKLSNLTNIDVGSISYVPTTFNDYKNETESFKPYFTIKFKCLIDNIEKSLSIIEEVINNTNFFDVVRLKQIVEEIQSRVREAIMQSGHMVAYRKLLSYMSSKGVYDEKIYGLTYYKFICNVKKLLDNNDKKPCEKLQDITKKLFTRSNVIISFSGEKDDFTIAKKEADKFVKKLNEHYSEIYDYDLQFEKLNEGILTQSAVNFVGKGGKFDRSKYTGALNVLDTILSYDYLWNAVRVKGGAYGVFSLFRRDGSSAFLSYRDPNINKTLLAYDGIVDYLNNFNVSDKDMTKYIIGTISKLDQPLGNSSKADYGDACYLSNLTYDMIQKERDEVINCTKDTIRNFSTLIKEILDYDCKCVLGNEVKIKNDSVFNDYIKLE